MHYTRLGIHVNPAFSPLSLSLYHPPFEACQKADTTPVYRFSWLLNAERAFGDVYRDNGLPFLFPISTLIGRVIVLAFLSIGEGAECSFSCQFKVGCILEGRETVCITPRHAEPRGGGSGNNGPAITRDFDSARPISRRALSHLSRSKKESSSSAGGGGGARNERYKPGLSGRLAKAGPEKIFGART